MLKKALTFIFVSKNIIKFICIALLNKALKLLKVLFQKAQYIKRHIYLKFLIISKSSKNFVLKIS